MTSRKNQVAGSALGARSESGRVARPATAKVAGSALGARSESGCVARPATPLPDPPPITLGSCVLRRHDVAMILLNSLLKMHGVQYELLAWCIMPNHVHVLVAPYGDQSLEKITQVWKSVSSHGINKLLGRSGQLWQHESFDHVIRSESSLSQFKAYIEHNPVESGLCLSPEDWKLSSAGCNHCPTPRYRFHPLPERRFDVRRGEKLPHLEAPGCTYFVTWRLQDAVARSE